MSTLLRGDNRHPVAACEFESHLIAGFCFHTIAHHLFLGGGADSSHNPWTVKHPFLACPIGGSCTSSTGLFFSTIQIKFPNISLNVLLFIWNTINIAYFSICI